MIILNILLICEIKKKMKEQFKIYLPSLNTTKSVAEILAKEARNKLFISLGGKLGTGKTTFARFFINALSKKDIKVLSPTFPLLKFYELNDINVWHYDLYRINKSSEIFNLDFDLALNDLVLMEWPEKIKEFLPTQRIEIDFYENNIDKLFLELKIIGNLKINLDLSKYEQNH